MLVNWDELLFLSLSDKMERFERVADGVYEVPADFVEDAPALLEVWRELNPDRAALIESIIGGIRSRKPDGVDS